MRRSFANGSPASAGASRMSESPHLLCELAIHHRAVGMAQDYRFTFPVTQAEIADATGLSVVHVDRVMRDLRSWWLISLAGGVIAIRDWRG
jgi:CRP-like cAMP-binding protein